MRWVLIVFCAISIGAQTVALQPGSIEGRVTNSVTGDLIPGVSIRLIPLRYRGGDTSQLQTQSQSDGTFHFDTVAPGNYIVTTEKDGFVAYQPGARPTFVSVQPGQPVLGVAVQITPQGSVSGKVVDDEGKPVAEAQVRAFSKSKVSPSVNADKTGSFTLPRLAPGEYYILADPPEKSKGGFVRTIYPHSLNFEEATGVQVTAGQMASNIVIRLRQVATYHIKGKVSEVPEGVQAQKLRITITPRLSIDAASLARSVTLNPDRTFEIDGLLPGTYVLRLSGQAGQTGRSHRMLARQDVEIGSASLENVSLQITPPVTLAGRVTVESQNPVNLAAVHVMAVPSEDMRRATQAFTGVAADGSFSLANLDPGLYRFRITVSSPGIYVKSVLLNQQDITNKEADLSQGASGQLEIVLRSGAGEIDGTVQPPDSVALIAVVPENLGPDGWTGVKFGNTRQGAVFSVPDVPPGRYAVFATDRVGFSLWENVGFLRDIANLGTSVQVDENGRQQIQLQKIPVEQIEDTAARLGLALQ